MATTTARPARIVKLSPAQLKKYFGDKLAAELGLHNVKRLIDAGDTSFVVVDVRSADGYRGGHIPGAINIPFETLPSRMKSLPKTKEIISYCWDVTCILSTKASYILASQGYVAREMIGGFETWKASGFPVEK